MGLFNIFKSKKDRIKELEKQKSSVPIIILEDLKKAVIKKSKEEKFICVQCGKEHNNHIILKEKKLSTRDFCSLKCFKEYVLKHGYSFLKQDNILNERYTSYTEDIKKSRRALYLLYNKEYEKAIKLFKELLQKESLKENKDIIKHYIKIAEENIEYKKNHFIKKWINVVFTISRTYEEIPKKQEIEKEAKNFLNEFRKIFMGSKLTDIAERGGPIQIIYASKKNTSKDFQEPDWTKDFLGNPEVTHQNFELKINKINNKTYEFRILFEPYSLKEYLLDGQAIYQTNEILCSKYQIPPRFGQGRICKMELNKEKIPIEISMEGLVEISYEVKDRLKQSEFNNEFDKIIGEDLRETLNRIKKEKKEVKGIEKEWIEKVERMLKK